MRCRSFRRYGQALARNLGLHPVTLESMNEHTPIMSTAPTITDAELRTIREDCEHAHMQKIVWIPAKVVGRILERMDAAERDLWSLQTTLIRYHNNLLTCLQCHESGTNSLTLRHADTCEFARFNPKAIEATA